MVRSCVDRVHRTDQLKWVRAPVQPFVCLCGTSALCEATSHAAGMLTRTQMARSLESSLLQCIKKTRTHENTLKQVPRSEAMRMVGFEKSYETKMNPWRKLLLHWVPFCCLSFSWLESANQSRERNDSYPAGSKTLQVLLQLVCS